MNLDLPGDSSRGQSIRWLKRLIRHVGPGFHLDTVPSDYVTAVGRSVFTPAECATLKRSLDRRFQILGSEQPYEIGAPVASDLLCVSRKPPLHFHDPEFQRTLLRDGTLKQLIAWLRWHGPQGFDSDQASQHDSRTPLTLDEARSLLRDGKKLLDTRHPAFRAVTAIRGGIQNYWRGVSVPYPEPGLRLIRQDRIASFDKQLCDFRAELREAVDQLQEEYGELRNAAKQRLGELYCASDYPVSLTDLFAVEWDFPSVESPDYLRQLSPEIYEQERARITARFDEAVRLAEEAFTSELARLVSHLTERLAGTDDGQPKVFRDTAVTRLQEFFTRFQSLTIHSDVELDRVVEQAQSILSGVKPQALREKSNLRQHVATQLSVVQSTLDGWMINRPRRAIIRPSRPEEE